MRPCGPEELSKLGGLIQPRQGIGIRDPRNWESVSTESYGVVGGQFTLLLREIVVTISPI